MEKGVFGGKKTFLLKRCKQRVLGQKDDDFHYREYKDEIWQIVISFEDFSLKYERGWQDNVANKRLGVLTATCGWGV